ncbi:type IX secretion system membrane protein PorP/SprF [Flavobacterium sp. F372]|uniref:Type IX secretion system membrane protein PorP/SprF n=1 Tax=Flavobacterium bernardetii TaxID=2813823 RepID=A0ABR7J2J7_9FLAO|nr:type IX secretion system membrane protein PorP/SprF [Flavobacterium bernardetii]MBC5836163.1 type IX secretion system membrane protein PorP/SprF [Flavobacterium bernardetii]NHF71348.1 type IX secretion system membrane protein PorP/SprF [Flavobacterium bernardetii]
MKNYIYNLLLLFGILSYSQQDSQYTQYMYNTINVNPAYAGTRETFNVFVLHRNQWVGLDGAPVTNTASVNTNVGDSKFGVGVSFVNDNIGPTQENAISADIAYIIPLNGEYKLSFGIKGTANLYSLDAKKLIIFQENDPEFQDLDGKLSPNFGTGVYFYSDKFYVGASVPNFNKTKYYDSENISINTKSVSYYLLSGYVFDLSQSVKFKPSFMAKVDEGAPLQLDVNANFMFNDKFVIGGSYRLESAVSLLAGFQFSNSWFLGYGYDLETTKLSNYNSGSHEIFLRYEFFKNTKISTPRFF